MSLDFLLSLIAIFVAVYSILNPVQRKSFGIFFPWKFFIGSIILSFILVSLPYFAAEYHIVTILQWDNVLKYWAFVIPVGILAIGIFRYIQARLTLSVEKKLRSFLDACLRENLFDEFERIIQRNRKIICKFSEETILRIFNPKFIRILFQSNSWVHLDLVSDERVIDKMGQLRHDLVDRVIRELLKTQDSPLQSSVVKKYGGKEFCYVFDSEQALIEKTFQNPNWYLNSSAHYPLVISAWEEISSGKLDEIYNSNGRLYESRQGVSARASCIVFLAVKTHVMAIESALENKTSGDFYVSDLWQIFEAIAKHSEHNPSVWKNSKANSEHPTPYAFLLKTITNDFRTLSGDCIKNIIFANGQDNLGGMISALAGCWSACVWCIAKSKNNVSDRFRDEIIEDYLNFILQLGFAPQEIFFQDIKGVSFDEWRDIFVEQIKERFASVNNDKSCLLNVINKLDSGKIYVQNGKDWLLRELNLLNAKNNHRIRS